MLVLGEKRAALFRAEEAAALKRTRPFTRSSHPSGAFVDSVCADSVMLAFAGF